MVLPKINCNQDGLLKKLDDAKDSLKGKLANIKLPDVDVESILAEIAADAKTLKDSLLAAVPEVPKLPDFQAELNKLKDKITKKLPGWEEDLQKFEKSWGGAIDDIKNTVDTLANIAQNPLSALDFDICKQPDVELNPDGTKKDKPIDPVDDTSSGEEETKPDAVVKPTDSKLASSTGSDIGQLTYKYASDAINDSIKNAWLLWEDTLDIAMKEKGKIGLRNYIGKHKDKLPQNFFRNSKYINAPAIEYWLVKETTEKQGGFFTSASVPDEYYKAMNKIFNLKEMGNKVTNTQAMIMTFFEEGGGNAFDNIKSQETKDEIALHYYNNHGYGLKASGYGMRMASILVSKESKQRIRPAFTLTPNDYTSSKVPTHYSVSNYIEGSSGEKDENFKSLTQDIVSALFNAKYDGESALALIAAYNHKSLLKDIKANMPAKEDFLIKALGGNVENYESSKLFQESDIAEPEKSGNYTEENFTPHWMYLNVDAFGANFRKSVYANTFQEHKQLQSAGYTHDKTY
jgi:hypothetical protein